MVANWSSVRLIVLAIALALAGEMARAGAHETSISEAALLPRFCWKQYMGPKFSGPGYYIPVDTCGRITNHYCPGLVYLNRAMRTIGNEGQRRADLLVAKDATLYTLRGIKGYPNCQIRAHVETTLRIIDNELKALH